jgi:hypothetical protein
LLLGNETVTKEDAAVTTESVSKYAINAAAGEAKLLRRSVKESYIAVDVAGGKRNRLGSCAAIKIQVSRDSGPAEADSARVYGSIAVQSQAEHPQYVGTNTERGIIVFWPLSTSNKRHFPLLARLTQYLLRRSERQEVG